MRMNGMGMIKPRVMSATGIQSIRSAVLAEDRLTKAPMRIVKPVRINPPPMMYGKRLGPRLS